MDRDPKRTPMTFAGLIRTGSGKVKQLIALEHASVAYCRNQHGGWSLNLRDRLGFVFQWIVTPKQTPVTFAGLIRTGSGKVKQLIALEHANVAYCRNEHGGWSLNLRDRLGFVFQWIVTPKRTPVTFAGLIRTGCGKVKQLIALEHANVAYCRNQHGAQCGKEFHRSLEEQSYRGKINVKDAILNSKDISIVHALPKEQFSIQNVRFRRALLSDFDAIMAFGDLYEGVDYFMAFYEEFLADADNFCVVAMVEDGVVGYGMTSLVDGGLTVVARCARVHPKYKGRGIFKAILDEVEKHTMRYRHSALYETQNMKSKDENIPLNNPYRPGYKSVHIRETRMIRFLQSTCSKYPDSMETPRSQMGLNGTLRRLRVADLRLLFNTEDVTRELFPSRKLLHFLVAYRLLDANIRHLTCKRSRVLVSLKPSEYACDSPPQNVRPLKLCNTGNNCKQLGLDSDSVRRISMMTNYFCYPTRNKGFSLLLDIHTRSRFSFDSYDIYSDLRAHLEYMKKDMQLRFPGRDGFVSIFYDKPLCTNQVLSCFKDLGIGELVPSGEKHAVTWERPKRVTQSKL